MESLQVDSMTSETANSETRDRLIERLHQEIDDLILAVEVEKLNHKETRQQNAELLAAKVKELKREQDEEMRRAEDDLDRKVNDLSKSYAVKIEECKRVGTETAEKLKLKIETLTSAFETYKKELREKMADEIEGQLETLHREHELSVHTETMALRSQIEAEKNVEKAEIERKFQEVCSQQKKEYQYDTEDSMVRFSQNTTDLEKLSYMQAKVKEVEKEIAETEAQCQMAIDRLDNSRLETAKLEAKLKEYEESFEDRVQCVHQKYCDEIDELKKLIESLQTCYLQKCETALDRQKLADVLLAQRVQTAKAALKSSLEERQRTAQRLTSSPPPLPPPVRPSSSPFKHRVGTVNEPGKFLKPVEITWQQLTV
jgi:phage host-nuclease inhibitor protein Gam